MLRTYSVKRPVLRIPSLSKGGSWMARCHPSNCPIMLGHFMLYICNVNILMLYFIYMNVNITIITWYTGVCPNMVVSTGVNEGRTPVKSACTCKFSCIQETGGFYVLHRCWMHSDNMWQKLGMVWQNPSIMWQNLRIMWQNLGMMWQNPTMMISHHNSNFHIWVSTTTCTVCAMHLAIQHWCVAVIKMQKATWRTVEAEIGIVTRRSISWWAINYYHTFGTYLSWLAIKVIL